jgi:hypothetical protein
MPILLSDEGTRTGIPVVKGRDNDKSSSKNLQSLVAVCKMKTELLIVFTFYPVLISDVGRDSSVGIATRYGLDGPGIESQ